MAQKKPKIWVSDYRSTTGTDRKTGIIMNASDLTSWQYVEYQDKYEAGEAVSPDDVPYYPVGMHFIYNDLPESYKKKYRDWFTVELGLDVVSERLRDLLLDFNIGETSFRELPLYEFDQVTPRPEGPFYLMHIRNYVSTFVPEQSENVEEVNNSGNWQPIYTLPRSVFAVDAEKAGDADMWFDPRLRDWLFFSDRLRTAIKEAKLNIYGVGFKKCLVV